MKVYLYNAISIDGYIAKPDDNTDWVCDTDWGVFSKLVKEKRVIIMGRRTKEASGEDFPYDCELNVVMTRNEKLLTEHNKVSKVWFTDKSPKDVIMELESRGYKECLIIGGGKANASFLEAGLINEIILSIHPVILGKGVKLFEGQAVDISLKRLSVKELGEGLVQIRYKVM